MKGEEKEDTEGKTTAENIPSFCKYKRRGPWQACGCTRRLGQGARLNIQRIPITTWDNLVIMSVAVALLSLAILSVGATRTFTSGHNPLSVTATNGPIVPSYNHAAATTTLSGVTSATVSSSVAPSATAISNGTLPACKSVQYPFPAGTGGNATRAAAVKEAYQYAWDAYNEYAWGYDELQPLSKTATNDWCKLSAVQPFCVVVCSKESS